jgi:hypothetical protein
MTQDKIIDLILRLDNIRANLYKHQVITFEENIVFLDAILTLFRYKEHDKDTLLDAIDKIDRIRRTIQKRREGINALMKFKSTMFSSYLEELMKELFKNG